MDTTEIRERAEAAKQRLLSAQCASYPNLAVPKILKPIYSYIEESASEVTRLTSALTAKEDELKQAVEFINWFDDQFSRQMPREYFSKIQKLEELHFGVNGAKKSEG